MQLEYLKLAWLLVQRKKSNGGLKNIPPPIPVNPDSKPTPPSHMKSSGNGAVLIGNSENVLLTPSSHAMARREQQ